MAGLSVVTVAGVSAGAIASVSELESVVFGVSVTVAGAEGETVIKVFPVEGVLDVVAVVEGAVVMSVFPVDEVGVVVEGAVLITDGIELDDEPLPLDVPPPLPDVVAVGVEPKVCTVGLGITTGMPCVVTLVGVVAVVVGAVVIAVLPDGAIPAGATDFGAAITGVPTVVAGAVAVVVGAVVITVLPEGAIPAGATDFGAAITGVPTVVAGAVGVPWIL